MSEYYPDEDDQIDLDEINGEIWEKHPDETDKQYEAFCHFRDLGRKRNKVEAYLNYSGKSRDDFSGNSAPSNWYEWSKKNKWNERVEAWDKRLDEKREKKYQEEMLEYSENMAKNAQLVTDSILRGLRSRLENKSDEELEELIFDEDGLDVEGISRTLATAKSFASEAFGNLTENDESNSGEADFLAEVKKLDD